MCSDWQRPFHPHLVDLVQREDGSGLVVIRMEEVLLHQRFIDIILQPHRTCKSEGLKMPTLLQFIIVLIFLKDNRMSIDAKKDTTR